MDRHGRSAPRRDGNVPALRRRVAELEETLGAIQKGEVEAVVVQSPAGPRVFTLQSADHAFRMMVEQMGDGAATIDPAGNIFYSNRRFAEIVGTPLPKVIGASLKSFAPRESLEPIDDLIRRAQQGAAEGETYLRRDGTNVPVYLAMSRLAAYDNPALAVVASDLTERRLTLELERRVKERTAALTAANRELEAFCYSVSHDLRGPLRGIEGYSYLLERSAGARLSGPERGQLQRLRSGAQRMAQIIDALLMMSRAIQGELVKEHLDLTRLARETAAELAAEEPGRRVRFDARDRASGWGDARLVSLLLRNLLGNAWKFTSRNPKPRVEFGAGALGGETVYYVRDNGVGFDMKFAAKMFEPFQRLHAAEGFPGTGIGLALVQRILARHGGKVWAESAPGKGAIFFFTLEKEGGADA